MVNNNSSYTQLGFAFVPQKDFYYVNNDIDAFFLFLFLLQKDFDICLRPFFVFFFTSTKGFWYLSRASFWNFSLCFWQWLFVIFLYLEKEIIKKYFYSDSIINFLRQMFRHQNFLHQNLLYQNHHKNVLYHQ